MSYCTSDGRSPERLLAQARQGDPAALGALLDLYNNYLFFLARGQMGAVLRDRLAPSDVVQETFLEAHRDFHGFRGVGEAELLAWLRRILVRNLVDLLRYHSDDRRAQTRQESLDAMLERSAARAHQALAAGESSPSGRASRGEQAVIVANALAGLPDDYREVIVMRHIERLRFKEIATRMGRTSGAVRKLWLRALMQLRESIGGSSAS